MKQQWHTSLLLFCILLVATGCKKNSENTYTGITGTPGTTTPGSKSYLALGDSYTIGQSVAAYDRFPVQIQNVLRSLGITINDPQFIATTGWTTTNLRDAITVQNPTGPFDAVSLLIGVNDQYQRHDTTGYRDRFAALLYTSIHLAGDKRSHVFVLSIPDYSVTPFARYSDTAFIRQQIDWFNAINKEVTLQNSCNYLDITPSTREAATDPSLIANDGLHPSGKEYKKWADRLAPLMKPVLQ